MVEDDKRIVEESKRELLRDIDEMKRNIAGYKVSENNYEKKIRQLEDRLNEKMQHIGKL